MASNPREKEIGRANLVEMLGPAFVRDVPILQMCPEELDLAFEHIGQVLIGVDVPLQAVDDAYKTQLEQIQTPTSVCVAASIKSSFVGMPIVGRPWGSIDRVSFSESNLKLAWSTLVAETARMTLYVSGCVWMYVRSGI